MNTRDYIEKNFELEFGRWVRHAYQGKSTLFELKATPDSYLNFNRLEEHQMAALTAGKHGKMWFKIPDTDYLNKRPCDGVFFRGAEAFVVVMYRCKERGMKDFYLIEIDDWITESGVAKSLSEQRAKEIGVTCKLV